MQYKYLSSIPIARGTDAKGVRAEFTYDSYARVVRNLTIPITFLI